MVNGEADWAFCAAYVFAAVVDARLRGKQHLRDCWGEAIFTLDELLVAIEDGRWPGPDPLPVVVEVEYAQVA